MRPAKDGGKGEKRHGYGDEGRRHAAKHRTISANSGKDAPSRNFNAADQDHQSRERAKEDRIHKDLKKTPKALLRGAFGVGGGVGNGGGATACLVGNKAARHAVAQSTACHHANSTPDAALGAKRARKDRAKRRRQRRTAKPQDGKREH